MCIQTALTRSTTNHFANRHSISCPGLVAILNLKAPRCCWLDAPSPIVNSRGSRSAGEEPLLRFIYSRGSPPNRSLFHLYSLSLFYYYSPQNVCGPHSSTSVTLLPLRKSLSFKSSKSKNLKMRFSSVGALLALAVGAVAQTPVPYVLRLLSHATMRSVNTTNNPVIVLRCRTLFSWSLRPPCQRNRSAMRLRHRLPSPTKWLPLSPLATSLHGIKLFHRT
jgi:hypothetical protein